MTRIFWKEIGPSLLFSAAVRPQKFWYTPGKGHHRLLNWQIHMQSQLSRAINYWRSHPHNLNSYSVSTKIFPHRVFHFLLGLYFISLHRIVCHLLFKSVGNTKRWMCDWWWKEGNIQFVCLTRGLIITHVIIMRTKGWNLFVRHTHSCILGQKVHSALS